MAKKRRGTYHGYKSKKQWKWAFATKQPWAREKAHKTKNKFLKEVGKKQVRQNSRSRTRRNRAYRTKKK